MHLSDLIQPAIESLEFYAKAIEFLDQSSPHSLSAHMMEYELVIRNHYTSLSTCVGSVVSPPPLSLPLVFPNFACEILWHIHKFHPVQYALYAATLMSGGQTYLGFDLVKATRCHVPFMKQIVTMRDSYIDFREPSFDVPSCECVEDMREKPDPFYHSLLLALDQYFQFLCSMRTADLTPVPSTLVDHLWHIHMNFPRRYQEDCWRLCGREVDHVVQN